MNKPCLGEKETYSSIGEVALEFIPLPFPSLPLHSIPPQLTFVYVSTTRKGVGLYMADSTR
jgi:hypothetical protein